MAAVALQVVSKPLPGADMSVIMANTKEAAELWKKNSAEISVWTVSVGEVGNLVFTARWENYAAYGKTMDALLGDKAIQTLMAKITASGAAEWVRSNLVREISFG